MEAASADKETDERYSVELKNLVGDGGYSPKQVFNADETGLYWKKMPNLTFISKNEKVAPDHKVSKESNHFTWYQEIAHAFIRDFIISIKLCALIFVLKYAEKYFAGPTRCEIAFHKA